MQNTRRAAAAAGVSDATPTEGGRATLQRDISTIQLAVEPQQQSVSSTNCRLLRGRQPSAIQSILL